MTALLRAEQLALSLGGRRVLDDVSFELRAGQWVAVVGPNGAGKSTLLSLLAGLRAPAVGTVWLQGRRLVDWPAR
jgi:iron complex transport system ATP-binding protein